MAYKFPSSGSATKLLAVDWSLGLGSRLTPVARLAPVQIAGVTVANATLHNIDAIAELDLRIGDTVFVERRGDVIPKVVRVLEPGGGKNPVPPKTCPSCETLLAMDGKYLVCPSDECPGKTYGDILKWINSLEIDSLGEKWVGTLIEARLLEDPADLYALSSESLVPLERMGDTLAAKIIQNIEETRNPPLARFIAALNITGFSRQRARMLIDEGIVTLEQLLAMTSGEIAAVKGFADISADGLVKGLRKRRGLIAKLKRLGVEPRKGEPAEEIDGVLNGKTFCFTGAIKRINPRTEKRFTRKQLQGLVKANGGRSLKDVTSKLDHLVLANPDSKSSKARKARDLDVDILSEEEFFALLDA